MALATDTNASFLDRLYKKQATMDTYLYNITRNSRLNELEGSLYTWYKPFSRMCVYLIKTLADAAL